jgi:hypothetical protein
LRFSKVYPATKKVNWQSSLIKPYTFHYKQAYDLVTQKSWTHYEKLEDYMQVIVQTEYQDREDPHLYHRTGVWGMFDIENVTLDILSQPGKKIIEFDLCDMQCLLNYG